MEGLYTHSTASEFVGLAVVVFVVDGVPIAHHRYYIWEYHSRSVIFVCVDEDSETFEFVF